MGFSMEDIDQVKQTLELLKDLEQGEIHIDNGGMKLSVWKGAIGDRAGGQAGFVGESAIAPPEPVEQKTAPPEAPAEAPAPPPATAVQEEPKAIAAVTKAEAGEEATEDGLVEIKASMISIFYRKPSPEEPPFVEVGSEVTDDTVVCLLEVMKCFRSINAEVNGRIEKICAETGQLVQEGDVLFLVRPS